MLFKSAQLDLFHVCCVATDWQLKNICWPSWAGSFLRDFKTSDQRYDTHGNRRSHNN